MWFSRAISALSASRARIISVAASSAMICIEERGGKPEQAGPVQPHRRVNPVSAGPFALRFRLGSPFARVDRVRSVGGRLDIAVAQVAATYANLKRNNRIYFTRLRRYFSFISFLYFRFSVSFCRLEIVWETSSGYTTKFAISHLLRVHGNATDQSWPAFLAADTSLAYLERKEAVMAREWRR